MNPDIAPLTTTDLDRAEEVREFLARHGTFGATPLRSGLFPAGGASSGALAAIGYDRVWVRDNVHLAHWLARTGRVDLARRTMRGLCRYFRRHCSRFLDIIDGRADPDDAMQRPHVRFDGATLAEVDQPWSHKQNDALGYFLWLACDLLAGDTREVETLALFPRFFAAVRYWEDEDSGHWEEDEKIEASSIGVVVAGIRALRRLQEQPKFARALARHGVSLELTEQLDAAGSRALDEILPAECKEPGKERRYDAALLFLVYPTRLIAGTTADRILRDVHENLQGDIGISRYRGDTFWAPDYKDVVPARERTGLTGKSPARERIEVRPGDEAQWCLFDSLLSTIYGLRYLEDRDEHDLELQVEYLDRALAQLTTPRRLAQASVELPAYRCPEAYYLAGGRWTPNDATPLLWAEANLDLALRQAVDSADARANRTHRGSR